ncbi:hypothetical protein SLT36_29325 (plasmid) [Aminobacter sp. BA135]|uniref:DUF6916 family protein n=1 Tax=Aminobacter sp. BA135 TaxID=537596 RepID=UPI003D7B0DA0
MISASDFESSVCRADIHSRRRRHAVAARTGSGETAVLERTSGRRFSLQFKGPREAALQQATYRFVGTDFADDIFIVPVSADATAVFYEAVFN